MFSGIFFILTALFTLIVATEPPASASVSGTANSCSVSQQYCCNALENKETDVVQTLLTAIGVDLDGVTAQVGLSCSQIQVLGIASANDCSTQPTCCTGDIFHGGVVSLGCSPINV